MKKFLIFDFCFSNQGIKFRNSKKGAIVTLVLVFGTIFVLTFGGLAGFIYTQYRQSKQKLAFYQALAVAEAGVNYGRWHLAHSPNDYDFSGTYSYSDPEGGIVGQYLLEIFRQGECSTITTIKSTGWTEDFPDVKRKVLVRYGQPSLAQYAFLSNEDVWFGPEEELRGPFHANGGIRMDGIQNALSTSAKETYMCQPMHGCSPAQEKPGIWGTGQGGPQGLWSFPVPAVDFNSLTLDLARLKSKAQAGGYYFGPSGAFGYRIEFKNDGTFNLYKVTKLKPNVNGKDTQGVWHNESNDIDRETFLLQSNPLPTEECSAQNLIFVEDSKVWVEGVTKTKATVAAAVFPDNPATNASIIINKNLTRADPKASVVALIAQKNILVPLYSNNILEIQAVMVAQKGATQRYYYSSAYSPNHIRNRIMVRGSIITNHVWTWSWVSGGNVVSGYQETEAYYEPALIYEPPPYFPTSGDLQFISWEEVQ